MIVVSRRQWLLLGRVVNLSVAWTLGHREDRFLKKMTGDRGVWMEKVTGFHYVLISFFPFPGFTEVAVIR